MAGPAQDDGQNTPHPSRHIIPRIRDEPGAGSAAASSIMDLCRLAASTAQRSIILRLLRKVRPRIITEAAIPLRTPLTPYTQKVNMAHATRKGMNHLAPNIL